MTRRQVFNACVHSVLLHGSESWAPSGTDIEPKEPWSDGFAASKEPWSDGFVASKEPWSDGFAASKEPWSDGFAASKSTTKS